MDLWYCVSRSEDAWYVDKLTSLCAQARVTLHLLDAHKGERLQAHYLTDKIANKGDTHFWFCGPQSFAKALSKGLYENGIASQNFPLRPFLYALNALYPTQNCVIVQEKAFTRSRQQQ